MEARHHSNTERRNVERIHLQWAVNASMEDTALGQTASSEQPASVYPPRLAELMARFRENGLPGMLAGESDELDEAIELGLINEDDLRRVRDAS